jgi:hypothetical protein
MTPVKRAPGSPQNSIQQGLDFVLYAVFLFC